ncbi:alpha-2-macroglobulin-like [Silurus meridionalis]|nr:alpha-2-macroglobulin-like [Silurus meridionalis]
MVTFPAVIESGSQATFCVSLLKPNETLQMNIYLVHNNETRTLLQETVEEEIHQCSHFEAPQVEGESVQEISVEVKGENFKMTEKRKVMFKSYNTLVFIQTDKPIYNPGQTVNFRIVTMDSNFIPLEQKDTNQNRIGQWTNVNSTGLILQLSHQLNAEAPEGDYSLQAKTENTLTTHNFKVQKYVLPKFEITVKTPEKHSISEDELKLEICGKYTYGQPVPGEAVVKVCREFMDDYFHSPSNDAPMISPCLAETVKMSQTGCAFLILNVSTFINSEFEDNLENHLKAAITLIEEGTEFSLVKSVMIELTFEIGKVELLDLPKTFEREKFIEGKIKVTTFSGTPVPNKKVYLSEGKWSPSKLLQNLTTDSNGFADFSVASPTHPTTEIELHVISKGAIVHHGHKKVEFEESVGVQKGEISFNLSVVVEFAPVVQVVVYSVLPSENVIAASKNLNVEKCFQNKVSLQFSPSKAVPGEKNTLELIAHPGSLCGLSAVDQSVFILESGNRLDTDKIFNLLPVTAVSDYPYMIEEAQECINVRPRRNAWREQAYNTLKLTVFQPFFLELSLPYSIIRGEVFELKATVFNYLSKCIMVKVTPASSADYTLEPSSNEYSLCLCANQIKTFKWTLIPTVLGDILGRALKNLDGLLRMPYGCGEQNIALLAPNIYILQYLENTGQLTTAIRERATGFLKSGLILQLSHQLNAEAPEGYYYLTAETVNRSITHIFQVKKYVLPKFEVTVKTSEEHSIVEEELKLEVCGKYTFGQPVPGVAQVQVCREFRKNYLENDQMISPCLVETIEVCKMSKTGCALLVYNVSTFLNSEFKAKLENRLNATITLTEEGTELSMVKSVIIGLTYQIGQLEFVNLPKHFERHKFIEGTIKVTTFSGKPIPNKKVYLLEGARWSQKLQLNLTTDDNGFANFSINPPAHPTKEITLMASVNPVIKYSEYKTPFFSHADASLQLFEPATPYNPVFSGLSIENSEEPLKCGAEIPITINYYIVGETTENYSIGLVYIVLSKGVIVHHGYEKVDVEESTDVRNGKISFKLSVTAELAPVVQVSLQFSPTKAVPGEKNTLELLAHPGSLCGLSAVDQSVFILEPENRLSIKKIFRLLPVSLALGYPYGVEDDQECLHVRPRRSSWDDSWAYNTLKLPVTVPDTITTWETEAFCVSSVGLGLAPPVQLTVFQPFFLELSLPYSIIRGEVFELKATVFNYLSKCIMVKVTPAPSSDYTLEPSSDGEYLSCLCANGRKTFKWTLIPAVLGVLNVTVSAEAEQSQTLCDNEIVSVPEKGRIDTVTRSLIVKGGVNDDVTMTAYITASLLELGHTVQDPAVISGLLCLKSSIANLTNTYATALLAYTFSLAGNNEIRDQLLKKLDSVAISGDGQLHWSQSALDDADALSVEISSYVLLAVLTTAELSAADLGYANRIVSWLVKQQNPYGGFSSTQDTVVALQALALYSTKVFSSDGSSTITVTSADGDNHNFDVNQNNKLLYQERSLKDVPGKYSIAVKGSTCVSVQTALFYNVPTPTETNTLSIVAVTEGNCTKSFGQTLSLNFTIKYNGELNNTNMIIVDIKLLSGFTADPGELKKGILVERIDSKDDRLIMYIKELPRNIPINYELHIKRVLPVKNLKPAWIKVYDYYQTSDQSEMAYTSPCV